MLCRSEGGRDSRVRSSYSDAADEACLRLSPSPAADTYTHKHKHKCYTCESEL